MESKELDWYEKAKIEMNLITAREGFIWCCVGAFTLINLNVLIITIMISNLFYGK